MSDPEDRANDKARVIDLHTFKTTGARTEPETPEFTQHADEAMSIANSSSKPKAVHGPVRRGLVKPKRDKNDA